MHWWLQLKRKNPYKLCIVLMSAGSACALFAAEVAQYGFGLYPCELCMLQRYPYFAVIVAGAASLWLFKRPAASKYAMLLLLLLLAADAGIAAYHSGVEQGIFKGPSACTSVGNDAQDLDALRAAIKAAPQAFCNQPAFVFLGLSMAAWNAIYALSLIAGTLWLYRHLTRKTHGSHYGL